MKRIDRLLVVLFSILTASHTTAAQDNLPVLKGPYLGQTPPGSTPKAFSPRGRSTEHRDGSGFFTPDMKEFYFTRKSHKDNKWSLVVFQSKNDTWHESVVGPRVGRPVITPDNQTMLLGKHYMERTKTGWSEIKSLGPHFENIRIMRLMASSQGTYYFDEASESGPIRYSRLINGKREKPKPLDIDLGEWNAHPNIAPDESYLIWDAVKEGGYGDSDLYISYRQPDGAWGEPINLGDSINTEAEENSASVTPDGKYLFFNRYLGEDNAGMFWVDAQILETLRPKS